MFGGKLAFLLIISTLVMIQDIRRCSVTAELPTQHGVNFLGIGYNIIEGNPEGGDLSTGGVDPGLLLSRRIFHFTFDQGKVTSDQQNRIPDEVTFVRRNSAFTTSTLSTFYGTASYASKLSAQVDVAGGYEGFTASVQFAASARKFEGLFYLTAEKASYQRVASKTSGQGSVFLSNETITNLGHARYETELAHSGRHLLSNGFVADSCRLPTTYTDETKNQYMEFMDDWGTHVVTEVALGIREGENLEEERSSFVNYAAQNVEGSISVSGAFAGFSASISVNMESFTSAMESGTSFGRSFSKYKIGSETLNEPISLKVDAMPQVFELDFWTGLEDYITAGHCTASFDRNAVKENMDTALRGYGDWHRIASSTNPDIRIPLTWPDSVYGLPRPFNGCPTDWVSGNRIHSSEGDQNSGSDVRAFAGWWYGRLSKQEFCIKTVPDMPGAHWQWQRGSYCIYQYGSQCPQGFTSGHIHWTEENEYSDLSLNTGVVPAGTYGTDTEIQYCCRNDGVTSQPIYLPTDVNFMLLARFDRCQLVHGMSVKKEWLFWSTKGISEQSDVHPSNGLHSRGIRLVYCYYYVGDHGADYPPLDRDQLYEDVSYFIDTFCAKHPDRCG